jgi:DNA polymerase-3 subunit epsilon
VKALIIDTETTALTPDEGVCIEVACILYDLELAAPIASYSMLCRAESNAAESINGISPALLARGIPAPFVWSSVNDCAAKAEVVLAHRADFDRQWVPSAPATLNYLHELPWVCTKFHVDWPKSKLGDGLVHVALAHGVGVTSAHRALTDCDILSRLLTRVAETTPLVPLIKHAMRPRVKLEAIAPFDEKQKVKDAGFAWDADKNQWWRDVPLDEVAALPFQTLQLEGPRVRVEAQVSYEARDKAKAFGFRWEPPPGAGSNAKQTWWREIAVADIAKLPFPTRAL